MTSLKVELTNIVSQKVVSPESVFLKDHDIQEVFKNEITLVFIPEMCFASNVGDDGSAYGPESLTLDLSKFSPSKVYGLGEDSMKLFLHGKEMPANNLIPEETAFCYVEAKLMPIDDKSSETEGPVWFNLKKKIVVNYNIPVQLSCEEPTEIKFVLITSIALEGDRISCNNCTRSDNFTAEVIPQQSAGIEIVIADSHILPFSVEQGDAVTMLHHDVDSQQSTAGRLYGQNPKTNTKFNYSCAELYYERYHKEQDQNNKLDNSKFYYIIGTNLMPGKNYGPILITIDKEKTLRDVKLMITKYIEKKHGASISESSFELYRMNTRPINPAKYLADIGNVIILKMKSA